MAHKYGVFQSTSKSCIFYKEDDDGNQSTFNIFISPSKEQEDREKIIAFIDNEQMKKENWWLNKDSDLKEVIDAFGGWAADAPIVFELEAHKSMSNCLGSVLRKKD